MLKCSDPVLNMLLDTDGELRGCHLHTIKDSMLSLAQGECSAGSPLKLLGVARDDCQTSVRGNARLWNKREENQFARLSKFCAG